MSLSPKTLGKLAERASEFADKALTREQRRAKARHAKEEAARRALSGESKRLEAEAQKKPIAELDNREFAARMRAKRGETAGGLVEEDNRFVCIVEVADKDGTMSRWPQGVDRLGPPNVGDTITIAFDRKLRVLEVTGRTEVAAHSEVLPAFRGKLLPVLRCEWVRPTEDSVMADLGTTARVLAGITREPGETDDELRARLHAVHARGPAP